MLLFLFFCVSLLTFAGLGFAVFVDLVVVVDLFILFFLFVLFWTAALVRI